MISREIDLNLLKFAYCQKLHLVAIPFLIYFEQVTKTVPD